MSSQLREARALLMRVREIAGERDYLPADIWNDIVSFLEQPHPEPMAYIEADRLNPRKKHIRRTIAGCKLPVGTTLIEGE